MDKDNTVIVLDIETTGLDVQREKIIEFAALKLVNGEITEEYETLINPQQDIRQSSMNIHGITQEMVADAPTIEEVMPKILDFIQDYPMVGHNVIFDYSFLNKACKDLYDKTIDNHRICTQYMLKEIFPDDPSGGLESLLKRFNIEIKDRHRAMGDARGLALAFPALKQLYNQKYSWQLSQLQNVDYLFERFLRIQQAIQVMQSELSDIKSVFKVYFEEGGKEIVSSTGEMLTYQSKQSYSYDPDLLKETLEEMGSYSRVFKLNNGLVDRMVDSQNIDEDIKARLSSARIQMSESKSVAILKPDRYLSEANK